MCFLCRFGQFQLNNSLLAYVDLLVTSIGNILQELCCAMVYSCCGPNSLSGCKTLKSENKAAMFEYSFEKDLSLFRRKDLVDGKYIQFVPAKTIVFAVFTSLKTVFL